MIVMMKVMVFLKKMRINVMMTVMIWMMIIMTRSTMVMISMMVMLMTMMKKIITKMMLLSVPVMTAYLLLFPAPICSLLHNSVGPVLLGHPAVPRLHVGLDGADTRGSGQVGIRNHSHTGFNVERKKIYCKIGI